MKVPNATITLNATNHSSSTKIQPRYFALMYRRVWGARLDPEKGIIVAPMADNIRSSRRYVDYATVATAELELVRFFTAGDPNLEAEMARHFHSLFPDGLRGEIEALLKEDAAAWKKRQEAQANAPVVHPSFAEAGLSAQSGLAFQEAGYATVADLPDDLLVVAETGGLDAGQAQHAIESAKVQREAVETLVNTKAAKSPKFANPVA